MLDWTWPAARPILFSMDAEHAHERTLWMLEHWGGLVSALASLSLKPPAAELARSAFGVDLKGPVGLAAGLDKDGRAIPFWPALGFGFVEVGTVTAHPQTGNPQPRLFRIVEDQALINRMGFNNHGSEALASRLRTLRESGQWPDVPVGANIGKSKVTPLDEAAADYALSAERLNGLVDWFTINVSSPNTPGLRSLQAPEVLGELIDAVLEKVDSTPVLLKLAPDLEPEAMAEAVNFAVSRGISGIIATNTTISRPGRSAAVDQGGGLSGAPLWPLAKSRIEVALQAADGRVPVIGAGGVHSVEQVKALLELGCVGVQLYTGLIFDGPGLPHRLNQGLLS
ncbi:MAG: quinone-dependent dihydroorotate dehydrogenase [Myxococcota bacterium]